MFTIKENIAETVVLNKNLRRFPELIWFLNMKKVYLTKVEFYLLEFQSPVKG